MMWCDHCNTHISVSGVLSCLRKDCKTKTAALDVEARKLIWRKRGGSTKADSDGDDGE